MTRRHKQEEHVNHERWLVSYADFVTLLFAFFVVMYAVSSVNEGKYRILSEALVAAFRSQPKSLDPVQVGQPVKSPWMDKSERLKIPLIVESGPLTPPPKQVVAVPTEALPPPKDPADDGDGEDSLRQITQEMEKAMATFIDKELIDVRRQSLWLEVEIKTSILFPSGSATLEAQAVPILKKVAHILQSFPNPIQVEGFTDNQPINTVAFPSNWELSAARAASVVHLFTNLGVQPKRMAAVGYGEYRPVADNNTPEGRNKNRRVVLHILAKSDARRLLDIKRR